MKKTKKVIKWMFLISLNLFILFLGIKFGLRFIINRITNMLGENDFYSWFEKSESSGLILSWFDKITLWIKNFSFSGLWNSICSFFSSIGVWFNKYAMLLTCILYLFVLLFICLVFSFNRSVKKYKYSGVAWLCKTGAKKVNKFWNQFIYHKDMFLEKNKKAIKFQILIALFTSFILFVVLFELLIFVVRYLYLSIFTMDTIFYLFSLIGWILQLILSLFYKLPLILKAIVIMKIIYDFVMMQTWKKLRKNYRQVRDYVKYHCGQSTIVNGPPGSGKTVSTVAFGLAAEDNMIRELEDTIYYYEVMNPFLNMANMRVKSYIDNEKYIKSKNKEYSPKTAKEILKKKNSRKQYIADVKEYCSSTDYMDYLVAYDKLYYRDSFIGTNFGMRDTFFNGDDELLGVSFKGYTKGLDMDMFRLYQSQEKMAFESYTVIILTEFDKECNSHDDKKVFREGGITSAFNLISHASERKVQIFMDYQGKDQLPKSIRDSVETFQRNYKLKMKYPKLLNFFVVKPLGFLCNFFDNLIKKYDGKKKKLEKMSVRESFFRYKRNDYTFFYMLMRLISRFLNVKYNYYAQFQYMQIIAKISHNDDMSDSQDLKYNINLMDLKCNGSKIFDSTFFGCVYDDIKQLKQDNSCWRDLDAWTSLNVGVDEFSNLHFKYYSKIADALLKKKENNTDIQENSCDDLI